MKSILLMIVAITVLQACTKPILKADLPGSKDVSSKDEANTGITGKWNWVKSEGGISFQVRTPDNTSMQLQLEFKNDGSVNYYKNGLIEFSGTYTLGTTIDPATGGTQQTITQNYFGEYGQPEIQELHPDSGVITFDEGGADRFVHTYKR